MTKYLNPWMKSPMVPSFLWIGVTTTKLSPHKLFVKCVFAQFFINVLYCKFQHVLFVGFSKIRSAGSDSNCKRLLVYCTSVVDASSKMFNSESS